MTGHKLIVMGCVDMTGSERDCPFHAMDGGSFGYCGIDKQERYTPEDGTHPTWCRLTAAPITVELNP